MWRRFIIFDWIRYRVERINGLLASHWKILVPKTKWVLLLQFLHSGLYFYYCIVSCALRLGHILKQINIPKAIFHLMTSNFFHFYYKTCTSVPYLLFLLLRPTYDNKLIFILGQSIIVCTIHKHLFLFPKTIKVRFCFKGLSKKWACTLFCTSYFRYFFGISYSRVLTFLLVLFM